MIVARGYITLTNIQGSANLLDWQSQWREGDSLPAGWSILGAINENTKIYGLNPFYVRSLLWKCPNNGGVNGFNTPYIMLEPNYSYRYCTFVFREIGSTSQVFHGTTGIDIIDGVGDKGNPYFISNVAPEAGKWFLMVGYIHQNEIIVQGNMSGIYDLSGNKIMNGRDYKMQNPNRVISFRNLQYCVENKETSIAYYYNPMLHKLDGTEPSIEQLLQVSTRKEIGAVKTAFNSEFKKLNDSISSKVSVADYNALGERVKKAETEILQTPEAINLAVRKIAVGTRNYVSHSKYNIQENVSNVRGWGVRCWKLVDDIIYNKVLRVEADGAYIVFNRNDFKCGDYVTISLTIKGERDGSFSSQISDGNGGNKWGDGTFSYTKEWQRVSITIKIPQGITANSDQNFCYYPTAPILIADVTINKGNVAAAWQLADEEMLNKDNILSSINLSEEGVKIDGKKVEITGELLAQIIKAKGLNVGDKTFIDALGNFKTVNATISGIINALSGSIGNFTIVNGDIIGVDTAKKERIRISTNPLPSLDSLITGYALLDKIPAYTADGRLSIDRVSESYYQGGDSRNARITLDGATSIKIVGWQGHTGYSDRSIYNPNWRLEVKPTKLTITSVVAGGLKIDNAPFGTPIPINYVGDVYITCDVQYFLYNLVAETNSPDEVCENINIPEVGIYKLGTTEKTYIGSDGFYSVFGSGEYVYFKRGVGFVTKGKTDMSGVLASGTVSANGLQSNVWGARALNISVTKGGVGIFNVPHNIGHTKYTVTASSYNNGVTVAIVSKSPYSVQLQVGANGGFYDVGFDYAIIGQN